MWRIECVVAAGDSTAQLKKGERERMARCNPLILGKIIITKTWEFSRIHDKETLIFSSCTTKTMKI